MRCYILVSRCFSLDLAQWIPFFFFINYFYVCAQIIGLAVALALALMECVRWFECNDYDW